MDRTAGPAVRRSHRCLAHLMSSPARLGGGQCTRLHHSRASGGNWRADIRLSQRPGPSEPATSRVVGSRCGLTRHSTPTHRGRREGFVCSAPVSPARQGTSVQVARDCDGEFSGWDARSEAKLMAGPLSKPRDKADRPKRLVPPGCCQMWRLLCRAPRHRSVGYDLCRASRMHPHLALQRNRAGLVQRFLRLQILPRRL
jgi:hypothetical protein